MRIRAGIGVAAVVLLTCMMAACATKTVVERPAGAPPNAEVSASLVVDQFLRAVNQNDLDTMARLFGNRLGSVLARDSKENVDSRMFALASVLRHESYAITGSQVVPGRRDEATQINVRMKIGARDFDVPWTLVYSTGGTWLVEQIEITRITGGR